MARIAFLQKITRRAQSYFGTDRRIFLRIVHVWAHATILVKDILCRIPKPKYISINLSRLWINLGRMVSPARST